MKAQLFRMFLILSIMFAMANMSCQSKSTRPNSNATATDEVVNALVTCAPGIACPEAVALVQIDFGDSLQQCTGFLTAGDVLATNSHCLPEDLQAGSDCDGKFKITFPATGNHPFESAGCTSVLKRSQTRQQDAGMASVLDLALLKLDRLVDRTPFSVDANPVQDGSLLTIFKVNPTFGKGVASGKIETASYTVVTRPNSGDPYLVLTPLSQRAQIPQGNSGSPVVDAQNHVRGILQGPVILKDKTTLRTGIAKPVPCLVDYMTCI